MQQNLQEFFTKMLEEKLEAKLDPLVTDLRARVDAIATDLDVVQQARAHGAPSLESTQKLLTAATSSAPPRPVLICNEGDPTEELDLQFAPRGDGVPRGHHEIPRDIDGAHEHRFRRDGDHCPVRRGHGDNFDLAYAPRGNGLPHHVAHPNNDDAGWYDRHDDHDGHERRIPHAAADWLERRRDGRRDDADGHERCVPHDAIDWPERRRDGEDGRVRRDAAGWPERHNDCRDGFHLRPPKHPFPEFKG